MNNKYNVGDFVKKTGGDYYFEGQVRTVFEKISGDIRYVIENDAGILLIMNERMLSND